MFGSTHGFPGAGWCIISVFFMLMVRPKLSLAIENLSTLLNIGFNSNVQCTVVSEQKLVVAISLPLGLSLRLKTELSVRYRMSIPLSEPLNASNSITETLCWRVEASTHPCLTPIGTGKAKGFLHCLAPFMYAVMKLSKDGDEFFGAAYFLLWFSKGHLCWPYQLLWSSSMGILLRAWFNPTFCKRLNRTSNSSRDWWQVLKKGSNDLNVQQNLYTTTTTTTINRGFTPNGINNECVSNSSKESSQDSDRW